MAEKPYAEKYWPGEYPRLMLTLGGKPIGDTPMPAFLIGKGADFESLEDLVRTVNSYVEDETRDGIAAVRGHHLSTLRHVYVFLIRGVENMPLHKPFFRLENYLMVDKVYIVDRISWALAERIRKGKVQQIKIVVDEPDIYCRLCPSNFSTCFLPEGSSYDDHCVRCYGLKAGECYPISEIFERLISMWVVREEE